MPGALREAGIGVVGLRAHLPDLPRSNCARALEASSPGEPVDAVIGIGGGSCLDLAKAVSVGARQWRRRARILRRVQVPGPGLPIIAVPTTGGTGAEVTSLAVIFDDERGTKMGCASPHLEPVAAIIDPELTLTCPPGLTAATAADALSHLVEGVHSRAKNPPPEDWPADLYRQEPHHGHLRREGAFAGQHGAGARHRQSVRCRGASARDVRGLLRGLGDRHDGTAAAHAIQSPMAAYQARPARLRRQRDPALRHAVQPAGAAFRSSPR